jgi:hypothetical protein
MRISCLTFSAVGPGMTPVSPVVREPDPDGAEFLCRHIDEIRMKTRSRRTYPARFDKEDSTRELFRTLLLGAKIEFAAAAETLVKRLIAQMDARTKRGLLVCVHAEDGEDVYGGVLKLDVEDENAGVLHLLDDGQAELGTISDVLTRPSDLKKGALITNSLPPEQVMVVDRMTHAAAYFPRAFGIQTVARPDVGASALLMALGYVSPALTEAVANVLPGVPSGEKDEVLAALRPMLPAIPDEDWSAVNDELQDHVPPVAYIDTTRPVTVKLVAGDITISGPAPEMFRLVRVTDEAEGWTVRVDSRTAPEWLYPQANRLPHRARRRLFAEGAAVSLAHADQRSARHHLKVVPVPRSAALQVTS